MFCLFVFGAFFVFLWQTAVGGSDEERALRKKKRKSKEEDRFNAVKSAIIKLLGDTCDVSGTYGSTPMYCQCDKYTVTSRMVASILTV